ncbi:MAG: TIGR03905 family TSCPD domain-containing protein [Oscillibacter sp.]|nr:TIGR03905 family TSCPD domain-containing protein [Oscillibacter sp.]
MTHFEYQTRGTCSRLISLDLDGERVHNVRFVGGCDGNLKAISSLVEGLTVQEITDKVSGIRCGAKNTSCGDQLARAVQAASRASA